MNCYFLAISTNYLVHLQTVIRHSASLRFLHINCSSWRSIFGNQSHAALQSCTDLLISLYRTLCRENMQCWIVGTAACFTKTSCLSMCVWHLYFFLAKFHTNDVVPSHTCNTRFWLNKEGGWGTRVSLSLLHATAGALHHTRSDWLITDISHPLTQFNQLWILLSNNCKVHNNFCQFVLSES